MKTSKTLIIIVSILFLSAATASAKLYFPLVVSGGDWDTELCIINVGGEDLSGTFKAYNSRGVALTAEQSITLPSFGRKEVKVSQSFPEPSSIGYLIFEIEKGEASGYAKIYTDAGYRIAFPAVSEINKRDIYIPLVISDANWLNGFCVLNSTQNAKDISVRFNTGDVKTLTIAAKEQRIFTIEDLFENEPPSGIVSGVIENAAGLIALEIFFTKASSGLHYLTGIPLNDKVKTRMYYPHIASDAQWLSGVVLYNPLDSKTEFKVIPYSAAGAALSSPLTFSLSPKSQYIGMADQLSLPEDTAWFGIESDNGITGFEFFGTRDGNQLASYSGINSGHREGVVAKIEKNGWNDVVFVNVEDAAANVLLTLYDDNGYMVGTATIKLGPHEKNAFFFEGNITDATYVAYASDRELAVLQFNGSSDGSMLDALPGLGITEGLEENVTEAMDMVFEASSFLTEAPEELSTILTSGMSGGGGTCPAVTAPEIDSIENLPSSMNFTVDYGAGCDVQSGNSVAGSAVLDIQNLDLNSGNAQFTLTFDNMSMDGTAVADGMISGSLDSDISEDGTLNSLDLILSFDDLLLRGDTIDGDITISAGNVVLDLENPSAEMTLTFNGFSAGKYTVDSGTITYGQSGVGQYQVVADLETNEGPVDATFLFAESGEEVLTVNTVGEGTIAGYNVQLTDVTLDPQVCPSYPSSGTATINGVGKTGTITFTGACDGNYSYAETN